MNKCDICNCESSEQYHLHVNDKYIDTRKIELPSLYIWNDKLRTLLSIKYDGKERHLLVCPDCWAKATRMII